MAEPQIPKVMEGVQIHAQKPFDRLTMNLTLTHEHAGADARQMQSTVWRNLEVSEELWSRPLKATAEWQPVVAEGQWLAADQIGLIVVENQEGKFYGVRPSKEAVLQAANRVVELNNGLVVYPGWPQPMFCADPAALQIRCRSEEAKCRIWIFPR